MSLLNRVVAAAASFAPWLLLLGCEMPPTDVIPAAGDGQTAPVAVLSDDLFEAWLARVPEETAQPVALILGPAAGDALFGVVLEDAAAQYSVLISERGDDFAALMLDSNGAPIVEQTMRDDGVRLTFFPAGDTLDVELLDVGYRLTATLNGTTPPSTFVVEVDALGVATLTTSDVAESINPDYPGVPATSKRRDPATAQAGALDCEKVAGAIQYLATKACSLFEKTAEITVSKLCEQVSKWLEDAKKSGAPEAVIDRLQAGLNLACKSTAVVKEGAKFFKRLTGFGWACLILDFAEDLSVLTTGESLSTTLCGLIRTPCPPGSSPGPDGECAPIECPPGFVRDPGGGCVPDTACPPRDCPGNEVLNPLTCDCECPPGTIDGPFGLCECPGDQVLLPNGGCGCAGGMTPGPDGFCECPSGSERNPLTGECECAAGLELDPITGECRCPDGLIYAGDLDDGGCIDCAAAAALWQEFIIDFQSKAAIINEQIVDWGRCVDDCVGEEPTAALFDFCTTSASSPCASHVQTIRQNFAALVEESGRLGTLYTRMIQAGCTNLGGLGGIPVLPTMPPFGG